MKTEFSRKMYGSIVNLLIAHPAETLYSPFVMCNILIYFTQLY